MFGNVLFNNLTKRELEAVENLVIIGSLKGAANIMRISTRTLEKHLSHIKPKLGIQHKSQLNQLYIENFYEKKIL